MRRRLLGGLAVACLAAMSVACSTSDSDNDPTSFAGYRLGADGRQLVLVVETGPEDKVVGGKVVDQDTSAVTVEVTVDRHRDLQPAVAVSREVTVTLADPLGTREVYTRSGQRLQPVR